MRMKGEKHAEVAGAIRLPPHSSAGNSGARQTLSGARANLFLRKQKENGRSLEVPSDRDPREMVIHDKTRLTVSPEHQKFPGQRRGFLFSL